MNYELIGLLVTIFLGIPSVITLFSRNNSTIYLVIIDNINIFREIAKNIEDLNITYRGQQVNENTFLLKAYIFYLGKRDITKKNIFKNLKIELPKKSKFHTYKSVYSNNDIEINSILKDNIIEFEFDLIKNKDFFYFESFLEHSENKISDKDYSFVGRIENINNLKLIDSETVQVNQLRNIVTAFMVFVISATFTFFTSKIADYTSVTKYNFDSEFVIADNAKVSARDVALLKRKEVDSIFVLEVEEKKTILNFLFDDKTPYYKLEKGIAVRFKHDDLVLRMLAAFFTIITAFSFFVLLYNFVSRLRLNYIMKEIEKNNRRLKLNK